MSIEHFSPLDGLQKRTGTRSDLMGLQHENVSVISFDSIQTTGRLLDKLDLSAEEELLLQKALEESDQEKQREETSKVNRQKPSVCLPASGFLSLRHSSGHSGFSHRRISSTGSTPMISEDTKRETSKAIAVENNVADLRYSYIAVEEHDDDEVQSQATELSGASNGEEKGTVTSASNGVKPNTSSDQPINIEKFRFKKHEPVRYNVTPAITDMMFSPYNKYEFGTPVNTPSHTPKTSLSSIVLNHPSTQSSSESEQSNGLVNGFQTPKKSTASNSFLSFPFEVSTPPSKDFKKGHQSKKSSSFSFKNLFKSPKISHHQPETPINDYSSPMSNKTIVDTPGKSTSVPNTPTSKFKFPHQLNLGEENERYDKEENTVSLYKDKNESQTTNVNQSTNHKRSLSKGRGIFSHITHANNQRSEPQTSSSSSSKQSSGSASRSQHSYKMLLDPRPTILPVTTLGGRKPSTTSSSSNSSTASRNDREPFVQPSSTSQGELVQRNNSNKRLIAKQRINIAIELRNKGDLKGSTAHLKEACKLEDRTAFLLYGLALRYGSGTEIDLHESFNWIRGATGIKDFKTSVLHANIDPFEIREPLPSLQNDAAAPALYECGIAYMKGYGVTAHEWKGLKCLEYAASLGHVDSMCLCGTIWSKTTPNRKKDLRRAAKWFRLAKDQGADLIGADWIYKTDYL